MSVQLAKFTVEQYHRMIEAGVFPPEYRAELIEGEIVEMSPIGPRHASCVGRLTQMLTLLLQRRAIVWVQNPLQLDDLSEPEPDVCVLRPRADFYSDSLPTPADALLIIEVSETTLEYDRKKKLPLYARAGVPEVSIVNLVDNQIATHADPAGGAYRLTGVARRGGELRSRAVDGLGLGVSEALG